MKRVLEIPLSVSCGALQKPVLPSLEQHSETPDSEAGRDPTSIAGKESAGV